MQINSSQTKSYWKKEFGNTLQYGSTNKFLLKFMLNTDKMS